MTIKKVVKLELWIVYSLIAALAFGVNAIVYKIGIRGGVNPFIAAIIFTFGVLAVFVAAAAFNKIPLPLNIPLGSASIIFVAGIIWAVGFLMITLGFAANFDASKMSLVYNLNFIVTVLLGIIVLKELQGSAELIRVLAGTAVMIAGILIVSLK